MGEVACSREGGGEPRRAGVRGGGIPEAPAVDDGDPGIGTEAPDDLSVADVGGYDGRPKSEGTNWLLIGSDSREELTDEQKKDLATGDAAGTRTDTIMLIHTGGNGTSDQLFAFTLP